MTTNHNHPAHEDTPEHAALTLRPEDAVAIDALVDAHGQAAPRPTLAGLIQAEMAAVDPARLARSQAWVKLIQSAPVSAAPQDLVARTLAAVQQDRMKLSPPLSSSLSPLSADPGIRPRRWSRRIGEYAAMAVAACMLVAVLVPGIATARQSAKRVACASNLGYVSQAFAAYAANDNGALPALAKPADGNWLPRGPGLRPVEAASDGHSNSANLLPLIDNHYMPASRLLCAGRDVPDTAVIDLSASDVPEEVRGYSYANMYGDAKPHWDGRHATIVLADRNPLFGARITDNVHANSFNHGGTGTYLIRADGTISWETSPDVGPGGDNIWTLGKQCQRQYRGTETVTLAGDVFLAP